MNGGVAEPPQIELSSLGDVKQFTAVSKMTANKNTPQPLHLTESRSSKKLSLHIFIRRVRSKTTKRRDHGHTREDFTFEVQPTFPKYAQTSSREI